MGRKLKYIFSGENISRPALLIIRGSVMLSCALLALSLLMEVWAGPMTARNVHIYRLAADLYRAPQGVLLAGFVGALIVDSVIKGER